MLSAMQLARFHGVAEDALMPLHGKLGMIAQAIVGGSPSYAPSAINVSNGVSIWASRSDAAVVSPVSGVVSPQATI
jgi:hypothetical protein